MGNRARFYDPQLGRFISEDPIGFGGGDINLYGYVWQSPLRLRDPLGLDGWAQGDIADWADPRIEAVRRWLEPNPDNINWNTLINYGGNTWHGFVDLLRVGRGLGRYLNNCGDGFDVLRDVGRASGIALILAGTAEGPLGEMTAGKPPAPEWVDLTDSAGRTHILDGDGTSSGGHRPGTGIPEKSEFPKTWSDEEILHHISDVATDPASLRTEQGLRLKVEGTRKGVDIRVILDPTRDGRIVTGFPTNLPRNP
jgi:hypothetical protein